MRYVHGGRTDQYKASLARWKDAEQLRDTGRRRGAMYLAGYALECRLKAVLMERHDVDNLEDLTESLRRQRSSVTEGATHNLAALLECLNLGRQIQEQPEHPLRRDWQRAIGWSVNWRYDPQDCSEEECREFLGSINAMVRAITNAN